jgi:hypothetical protein
MHVAGDEAMTDSHDEPTILSSTGFNQRRIQLDKLRKHLDEAFADDIITYIGQIGEEIDIRVIFVAGQDTPENRKRVNEIAETHHHPPIF